jgi:hypothetical protein
MRRRVSAILLICAATVLTASPVRAQYGRRVASDRATGETYHVEVGGYFWNPTPDIAITSESLGIIGSTIDFVEDLGIEKKRFNQLKVVLRPGTKHKFRFEYTPIKYEAQATLQRNIVFNGILFPLSLPVATELKWRAFRFGYEWDVIYRERGFFGLVFEAKYTDVEATLSNILDVEFVRARAPIPALGGIGRVYVAPNISITGEFTAFKVPGIGEDDDRPEEPKYKARYFDFDLYGTVNFTDNFGAQAGYRSFSVLYKVDDDEGDLVLKGLYIGGVARF